MTTQPATPGAPPMPRRATPPGACNAHIHIYDHRFPFSDAGSPYVAGATVDDYRALQARIGTQRVVIVTPRPYGTDNRVTVDAIAQLGQDHARGVAVLRPDVTDAELAALDAGGIRGIRFTLYTPKNAVVGFDMVEPLAARIAELGWHVQLHWTAEQIVEHEAMLARLPSTIVFDHLGRLPVQTGAAHPAFSVIRRLADSGRVWVKASGPYLDSLVGEAQGFGDMTAIARAWIAALPERIVWGSDWPHVTEQHKPDDAALLDLLADWTDDKALRKRILVDNAAALYGFASAA